MLDIVIVTVPGTLSKLPPAAPALLKASIQMAGFTCKTLDFNIDFYKTVKTTELTDLENFFSTEHNIEVKNRAQVFIEKCAKEIVDLNPRFLGISVFTYQNRTAAKMLCEEIRRISQIKIILGGQGLTEGGILGSLGWAKELKQQGLTDFFIKSEGERSLVELLKGNITHSGINTENYDQIDDLDSIPIPDYGDYNLSLYEEKLIPITASRGCVRSCSFCDIHDHWKYKFRSGKSVADEMIMLHEKYQVENFYFTDSLVNGSLREFRKFCNIMSEYNQQYGSKIKWTGQYIVRGKQHLTEEDWKILAKSGAYSLFMGIETGSDKVRKHMNKNFTNADLDYTMEMLDKYNITCVFLMIIGYPTETKEDFNETLAMFERYQHLANTIIIDVNLGTTVSILEGTPLYKKASEYNIEIDKKNGLNWIANNNPDLTISERLNRLKKTQNYIGTLGYKFNNRQEGMMKIIEDQIPIFEKRNKIKKMIEIKSVN